MTLEEGIIHAEDVARMNHEAAKHLTDEHPTQAEKCEACAKEHEQLTEWLKDYKRLLEQEPKLRQALELEKGAYNALVKNIQCADCISRQAVLDKLNRLIEVERLQGTDEMGYGRERVSAYECMIHAVESEYLYPSVTPQPCEDAISRQAAIMAMKRLEEEDIERYGCSIPEGFDGRTAIEALQTLPPVSLQQKVGRWIPTGYDGYADGNPVYDWWECSECGWEHTGDEESLTAFCPNCGAKMEVKDAD